MAGATHSAATGGDRDVLLYDGDCGFCRASAGLVMRLDGGAHLRAVAIQSPAGQRELAALAPTERLSEVRLARADGTIVGGGAALAGALRVQDRLGARALGRLLAAAGPATELGYRAVARNRGLLSRLVPARAVRRADAELARRERAGP